MTYVKKIWTDGEIITAAKLNNMENQIEEVTSSLGLVTGIAGPKGEQGIPGEKGDKGDKGDVWRPSVDSAGNIHWTLSSSSDLTVPDEINIKGERGEKGEKGERGEKGDPPDLSQFYSKNEIDKKSEELFQYVSNGKNLLEATIADKGIEVSKKNNIATFEELSMGIKNIESNIAPIVRELNNKFDLKLDTSSIDEIALVIRSIVLTNFNKSFNINTKLDFSSFNLKTNITLINEPEVLLKCVFNIYNKLNYSTFDLNINE